MVSLLDCPRRVWCTSRVSPVATTLLVSGYYSTSTWFMSTSPTGYVPEPHSKWSWSTSPWTDVRHRVVPKCFTCDVHCTRLSTSSLTHPHSQRATPHSPSPSSRSHNTWHEIVRNLQKVSNDVKEKFCPENKAVRTFWFSLYSCTLTKWSLFLNFLLFDFFRKGVKGVFLVNMKEGSWCLYSKDLYLFTVVLVHRVTGPSWGRVNFPSFTGFPLGSFNLWGVTVDGRGMW